VLLALADIHPERQVLQVAFKNAPVVRALETQLFLAGLGADGPVGPAACCPSWTNWTASSGVGGRCCRCALLGALTVVLLITLWIVGD
jgi:hypothetical protein